MRRWQCEDCKVTRECMQAVLAKRDFVLPLCAHAAQWQRHESPTTRALDELIAEQQQIKVNDLVAAGIAESSARYYLRRYTDRGLLRVVREGRNSVADIWEVVRE